MVIKINKLLGLLLFLYLVLKPFYFWSSGVPQVSDFVLIAFLAIAALKFNLKKSDFKRNKSIFIISLFFLYYSITVNLVWSMIITKSFLMTIVFYAYNIIAFLIVIEVVTRNKDYFLKIVYQGVVFSILLQFVLSFLIKSEGPRATIFFNNPNQLGYYVLLMMSIAFIIYKAIKPNNFVFLVCIIGSFYLAFISLSKAALMSCLILIGLFMLFDKQKKWFKFINLFLFSSFSFLVYAMVNRHAYLYGKFKVLDTLLTRIHKGEEDTSMFYGRGYDRIVNHPEYLIFGAGEGHHTRFNSILPLELHSIPGTIFFSYGIIGASLFLALLLIIALKNRWIWAYPLLPIILYGLTHNGLRNSLLWMCLSMLVVVGNSFVNKAKNIEK